MFFGHMNYTPASFFARLNRLEQELSFCQSLLWMLVQRLDREQPDGLASILLSAGTDTFIDEIIAGVDARVRDGQTELALRRLRETTAAEWETLYEVVASWPNFSREQKRTWLRFARMQQTMREHLPAPATAR
jgi:hypothetical protein